MSRTPPRRKLQARVLAAASALAPDPLKRQKARWGRAPGEEGHELAYAKDQYLYRVRHGIAPFFPPIFGKDVLEIGCGHGGVSLYMASLGPRRMVGVDLNTKHLAVAEQLRAELASQGMRHLESVAEFKEMSGAHLDFPAGTFDVVVADNLFEHVDDPEAVMAEAFRVLRPGGKLVVPVFSSIYSKHGLHLKVGFKIPWANLVFSEESIVDAVKIIAERDPSMRDVYPGLASDPKRVRDLRRHKDLNDITHREFVAIAKRIGFHILDFRVYGTVLGRALLKTRVVPKSSLLFDALSTGAGALLEKRA